MNDVPTGGGYRGRLAPSPTGWLHLGHARTFWTAARRAMNHGGVLVLRVEDLDGPRCRPEFVAGIEEDLRWLGITWQEGPDLGGALGPYVQSRRQSLYRAAFERLRAQGDVYACTCSRRDVAAALSAPHAGDEEPVYPGTCRDRGIDPGPRLPTARAAVWRFRVPDGESVMVRDAGMGDQTLVAGVDFGDFVVWRGDDLPSYQLACVVDDHHMAITEVVRGADLLVSAARQLLLFRALGWESPGYFHCPLMLDEAGRRLAKRHDALSLRRLREQGVDAADLIRSWG